jgi:hypothetical protein
LDYGPSGTVINLSRIGDYKRRRTFNMGLEGREKGKKDGVVKDIKCQHKGAQ